MNPLLCNFYMSSFFIFLFPLVFLVVFTFVFLPAFIFFFNFKCLKFSIFFIAFDCQVSRFQNTTRPYIISIIIILFLSCPRFSWFSYFSCLLCLLLFLVCFYLLVSFCLNYFVLFVFCVCFLGLINGVKQNNRRNRPKINLASKWPHLPSKSSEFLCTTSIFSKKKSHFLSNSIQVKPEWCSNSIVIGAHSSWCNTFSWFNWVHWFNWANVCF